MAGLLAGLSLEKVLLVKEASDFIQIGLIAWQTGKRFKQQQSYAHGGVGIENDMVSVRTDSVTIRIPIDDAAGIAGVPGAASRGMKPLAESGPKYEEYLKYLLYVNPIGWAKAGVEATFPHRPSAGQDVTTGAVAPNPDQRPFTLREYALMQEAGAKRGSVAKAAREAQAAQLQREHEQRLAALDAEIAREKIAGEKDITRLQIAGELQQQRERLAAQFVLQERALAVDIQRDREKAAAEERQLGIKFEQQRALQEAEDRWKTSERQATQTWSERVKREGEDWAEYYKNLNADLALSRSLEAARKIGDVVAQFGKSAGVVVDFAQAFAR